MRQPLTLPLLQKAMPGLNPFPFVLSSSCTTPHLPLNPALGREFSRAFSLCGVFLTLSMLYRLVSNVRAQVIVPPQPPKHGPTDMSPTPGSNTPSLSLAGTEALHSYQALHWC
jgi:hypothetical protein